ncbi:DMT family transporter [Nitrosopumilus sp.]|uniref:DMT family transporter n=1 Tax=Nitrosopumilus sp. TaxID=2024843 RepID=UPI00247B3614|nr:DMT family transporter [Nitrosopumilus sp.]MCV0430210.1 DMT family transporter [Nitrosopumilus sp.]
MIPRTISLKKPKYGYYFIILAAALSALIHVISKPMLENSEYSVEINPIVMAFLIYFICGIFFTPLSKKSHSISKFGKKDWMFMGLIGISEVSALITYFYGLSTSTAVNASIFSNSEIIFALIIAMLVFKEKLRIKECIPFSMIIIGMMVIPIANDLAQNNFSFGSMVTGDILIIFSGFLYAVDITLCKYVGDRFDVKRVTQIVSFVCAAVAIFVIAMFQIPMDIDIAQLPGILIMSILGTGMSTLFFLIGLKLIGAVRTVLLYSTTSVFGVLFSGLMLAETISTTDIISLILVLSGIFLLRNKLAEGEDEINEETSISNIAKNKVSANRGKHVPKSSTYQKIEERVIFQSWIGAG